MSLATHSAQAVILPGYSTGAGANTSTLVVDFAFSGGDAYQFQYSYDGSATGEDMLLALDAAGPLTVDYTVFTFGGVDSIFVNGFTFDGNSETPAFEGALGENWSYWVTTAPGVPYTGAATGPTDRVLSDGSVDGWGLNVSAFNTGGFTPTNDPPALPVPEPASLTLLAIGASAVLRRRR